MGDQATAKAAAGDGSPELVDSTTGMDAAPAWEELGVIERFKLREALRDQEDIHPRLVPAALEHLETERRHGLLMAGWVAVISVLVVGPMAAVAVWWFDRDVEAAVFLGVFMALLLPLTFGATGLYQAGLSSRRLRWLRRQTGQPELHDRTGHWSWRLGRLLSAGFLAFMTWIWISFLILGPGLRALDMGVSDDLGGVIGFAATIAFTIGYYRFLEHRDLL